MNKNFSNVLIVVYSILVGTVAYKYVPLFYIWACLKLENTGPLIILIIGLFAGLYYFLTKPFYYISIHTKWDNYTSDHLEIISGIISGAPLTIAMFINWWLDGLGGSFAGLSFVCFNGPVLGYFVYDSITAGIKAQNAIRWNKKSAENPKADNTIEITDKMRAIEIKKYNAPVARLVALRNITDQNILSDFAKNDSSNDVSGAAFDRLTDQSVIADVAINSINNNVRYRALNKLTDQSLIADVAKKCSHSECLLALQKLTDQSLIADVAKNSIKIVVRAEATDKLTDQTKERFFNCQNHNFERHSTEKASNHSESNITWCECTLCGLIIGYNVDVRYTD